MNESSVLDRVRSPRVALLANVALVMTGSVLALLAIVDIVTGALIVVIGFVGVLVSLLGRRSEAESESEAETET
ncbi:hypothetical protein [Natronolimnohabitans innermongolicus]|uniref:Major facilitator family transporter n=1 Tax=Natronolimnohabitans innermongolicus JCM 12255 TaxID=1227499 RepID=L9WSZ2_9EURY|nr:hypothetical protein [Natronolimnohabitans innermongolicus]ELY52565.1 major facilitator family transporter [Natronolimnohabitans innermongolicus JCM 12255]